MAESVPYKFKRPASVNGEPFRNTQNGCEFRRTLRESIIAHIDAQTSTLAAIPRCFRQFDRKTDCFDGGKSSNRDVRRGISLSVRGLLNRQATFKAVCGTQTRQAGSLNKNQPDSQNMRSVAVGGGCAHEAIESDNGIKRVMP